MLEIIQIAVLTDNYNYVVHNTASGETFTVDPSSADPILEVLKEKGWQLDCIINTHHHFDHIGGNTELKQQTGCEIIGFADDAARIAGITRRVEEGQEVNICGTIAKIIFVPGHTLGHIVYYFEQDKVLFCGDTIFSMGCGRLFEGTAEQMYNSLEKLKQLPEDTKIYCAHEYTANNGNFALTVEPDNKALQNRMHEVLKLREQNLPTIPTDLKTELATNPFLRTDSAEIRKRIGMLSASNVEVFAKIRKMKDNF